MMDLSDTFDEVSDEVFVDAGHMNMRGNFHVALRLSAWLARELGARSAEG
jgi:hypothetical protein